jgi:hypothetical protein
MTAKISTTLEHCGSCDCRIPAGTTLYLVTTKRLIRCEPCALKITPDLPQVTLAEAGPVGKMKWQAKAPSFPPPVRMFDPKKMAAHLFDWRAKQAGE